MTALEDTLQNLIDGEANKANTHGVLLAVHSGDGRFSFRGGAGAATPDRTFCIASVTKLFTAAMVLQLKDAGRLHLDTKVQSILPEYDWSAFHRVNGTAFGPMLTVSHLLHQTSGLADYYEGGMSDDILQGKDRLFGLPDVLRMTNALSPQGAPDSGKAYYSDTNYQLLGAIIETVSDKPFHEVLQSQICDLLGLRQTAVFDPQQSNVSAPLSLYHKAKQIDAPLSLSCMGPDGGIVSSLDDVLTFLQAFMRCELFDRTNMPAVQSWLPLFFPLRYGAGLMRFKLPSWMNLLRETPELIGHSGTNGSFAFYAPRNDIYLVGTFNQLDAPQRPFGFMLQVIRTLKRQGVII